MRTHRSAFFLSLLLVSVLLAACAEQKEPLATPHPFGEAWLVESPTFHGASFRQSLLNCSECHDVESFCTQCHFDPNQPDVRVPPGSGWIHEGPPPSHADLAQYGDICNRCHDIVRDYGVGPASCHNCHGPASPHPAGWLVPTSADFHGPAAEADLDSCKVCHGADLLGGSTGGVSCFSCHFGPDGTRQPRDVSPRDWNHDNAKIRHAEAGLFTAKDQAVCVKCHLVENQNAEPPPGLFTDCNSSECHPPLAASYHGPDPSFFTEHPAAAKANILSCQPCHDTPPPPPDFDGYVTGVACAMCHPDALAHPFAPNTFPGWPDHSSAGNIPEACAICHDTEIPSTGPSPLPAAPPCAECHSAGFQPHAFPFAGTHMEAAKADLNRCQLCHSDKPQGGPGSEPRFDVPFPEFSVAITNNGCESCHDQHTAHPVPWLDHGTAGNMPAACNICHGASLEGGTFAPACTSCHALDPIANAGCTSCHNTPPNGGAPVGDQFANRAGKHAEHLGLPTPGIGCTTCHPDLSTNQGAAQHYDDAQNPQAPAPVTLDPTYQAETGTLAFQGNGLAGGTCAGVSCHGGQEAPNWLTGTIDVNADCTDCHVVQSPNTSTQYNSAVSGYHDVHVNEEGYDCQTCHNTATLADVHFDDLNTHEMTQAGQTVGGTGTAIGQYDATTHECSNTCHGGQGQTRTWPVP